VRRRIAHALFWGAALVVIYASAVSYMVRQRKDRPDEV